MFAYVVRRVLATIPVMAVVALFVFSLLYIAPGDPAAVIAGDQATPADIERIRESLGLDRPYLVRFGAWCGTSCAATSVSRSSPTCRSAR
jgi:peptide/nickel transport system permease protein